MELGALVCTPAPACADCPVARHCAAKHLGLETSIPASSKPPRIEQVREVAVALRRRDKVLVVQRPDNGRWAGMWEFPRAAVAQAATDVQAARSLLATLGMQAAIGGEVTTIRHAVTRFRITLTCLEADYQSGRFRAGLYRAARWLAPARLADLPSSRPQRRLAVAVGSEALQ